MELAKKLDEYIKSTPYNGSVILVKDDKIILEKGYGFANVEYQIPNTPDTAFRVASITKEFTGAAILRLMEEGKISLDDKVSKYVPGLKYGDQVLVKHCLSNSAAIPNFDLYMDYYDILKSADLLLALIHIQKDEELLYEPGTEFYYSHPGYLILQYIIQKVTGKDFETYLKEEFFEALGMTNTGLEDPIKIIPHKAYGYQFIDGELFCSDYTDMRIAGAGGGMYSSVKDLYIWNNALMNGKVLQDKTLELMLYPHVRADEQNSYAYGIIVAHGDMFGKERSRIYHTGGGKGVRAINVVFPAEKVQAILVSNYEDRDTFNTVSNEVQRMLLE